MLEGIFLKISGKNNSGKNRILSIFIQTVLLLVILVSSLQILMADTQNYSPVTKACILCHNDTTYPSDTDGDGRAAPFKRPHNDTIMCEKCHLTNPHTVAFIQPDGSYGIRSTAASCPECHQAGIPAQNNDNFTTAPIIFSPLRHSSNILNGSVWGDYWAGTIPKTACYYCHGDLHNTRPLGRILSWYPNYQLYGSIGTNLTCAGCHYKGSPNYSQMRDAFASAGKPRPPEITNGTNWNGIELNYYNHSLDSYYDQTCRTCHGALLSDDANMSEFVHNVAEGAGGEECLACHISRQNIYPAINRTKFGSHINVNRTGGENNLTNDDCLTCHYDFNYTEMAKPGFTTLTYNCTDCHINGNFLAPVISNHRPPRLPARSPGAFISTTAYCSVCHNNSINSFIYSVNASVGHYGTNTSLIKPTVNQTPMPRFGFMNSTDARAYNRDCNSCHNPSNPNYGSATLITLAHTPNGTCNQCHVNGSASDLHNSSLSLPVTFGCNECHTTYASRYGAPNLTGTFMANVPGCDTGSCHFGDGDALFNTLADHNRNRNFAGRGGLTDNVTLNGVQSLSVSRGTLVTIRSRVNDSDSRGGASRVGGAEYYIDTDPGVGKGTPMDPSDGMYDAVNGNWEDVIAVLDTGGLSDGTYTVYVRGMDIGKQWSATRSAVLKIGPPQATIRNVILAPVVPRAGNEVNITVEIDNPNISFNGRVEGNVWSPSGEGRYLAWEDVVVPAGASSVTIIGPAGGEESSYKTMEQGIHRYDVFLENVDKGETYLDATDSRLGVPFNVDSATSVYMSAFNLSVVPTVGNLMTFNVTVTNPTASEFAGNISGNVWDSTQGYVLPNNSVNVPAGSSAIVTFEFTPVISGTHSYDFFLVSDVPADNDKKPFGFICKDYRAAIGFNVG